MTSGVSGDLESLLALAEKTARAAGRLVVEGRTGAVEVADTKSSPTDVVTADVDGDGAMEFVFGTLDGRVVALRSDTGAELWSIDAGAFAGTPLVAEGLLVVPVADGTVRVYAL